MANAQVALNQQGQNPLPKNRPAPVAN